MITFLDIAKEHLDSDKHKLEEFLVDIETKSNLVEQKLKKVENRKFKIEWSLKFI